MRPIERARLCACALMTFTSGARELYCRQPRLFIPCTMSVIWRAGREDIAGQAASGLVCASFHWGDFSAVLSFLTGP